MPWLRVNIEFGGEMPCCDELGCGARRRNKSHRGSCFPIRLGFGDDDDGTATPFSSIRFAWNAREEVSPQPLKKRSSSSLLVAPSVPWDDAVGARLDALGCPAALVRHHVRALNQSGTTNHVTAAYEILLHASARQGTASDERTDECTDVDAPTGAPDEERAAG